MTTIKKKKGYYFIVSMDEAGISSDLEFAKCFSSREDAFKQFCDEEYKDCWNEEYRYFVVEAVQEIEIPKIKYIIGPVK